MRLEILGEREDRAYARLTDQVTQLCEALGVSAVGPVERSQDRRTMHLLQAEAFVVTLDAVLASLKQPAKVLAKAG